MLQRPKPKALSRSQLFGISVFVTLALMGIASIDVAQQSQSAEPNSPQLPTSLIELPRQVPLRFQRIQLNSAATAPVQNLLDASREVMTIPSPAREL